ncbi:MAG: UDP-N-acetylmuramoyl-L-alanine--D-glutamate ligase [Alphaproteobacteria bacterium]|nr:UDP-N-acetylmuramoyl-L-alanine--D-glutamate ligase [Alphaproteobacteria bacterium]MDE2112719.1 UDP-N-acetylmuramoyl-L-alanine--D-glutamate ligase [Alphaproteobacteria bacterium]MDE2495247.1 UDP-N-acetylmuramoyl-L-alanine--D-glutamate ligase [Alphaproteobacteria bacterium]
MIPVRSFANRQVAVFGLARSGLASVRALKAGDAKIFAWDEKEDLRAAAAAEGAAISAWRDWPWDTIAALVLSPGVPFTHPKPHDVVLKANEAGVEVIGDIELFAREIRPDPAASGRAPVVAVTGTNGKSTTTVLIGHILSACGFDAQAGGNIGKSALNLAPPGPKTVYVLEVSSYQIDLSPGFRPDVAILSNITPDHIDRHGSLENYAAVKTSLLKRTVKSGLNIVGVDDQHGAAIFTRLTTNGGAPCVPVSVGKVLGRGIFVLDGVLYDAQSERAAKVMDLKTAEHLPGAHNWQNAALAYAATKPYIRDARAIAAAIADFPGLAHRIENVGNVGKVRFVNDSKATNADAAERALVCFPDIFWIAGGRPKEGGIAPLAPQFSRIRKAYLIGEAAEEFAATLDGKVAYEISGTLENAVASAAVDAAQSPVPAPVVLLSPACASFDQFRDFEQRGDSFRDLVAKLAVAPVREAS